MASKFMNFEYMLSEKIIIFWSRISDFFIFPIFLPQCPIITKPFADHTKIVAVVDNKTKEAYVYSYEAYKELNVTPKNWLDLTTGKKFSPKDVLILNDPQDEEFAKQRNIELI